MDGDWEDRRGGYGKGENLCLGMAEFADDWGGLNKAGDEKKRIERVRERVEVDGGMLNVEKSKVLMVGRWGGKEDFKKIEGVRYETELKLGGVVLEVGKRGEWKVGKHWKERIKKARMIAGQLREVIGRIGGDEQVAWRKIIMERKILPLLVYGTEVVEVGKWMGRLGRTMEVCAKWMGADEDEQKEHSEMLKKVIVGRKRLWEVKAIESEKKREKLGRIWRRGEKVGRGKKGTGWHRDFKKVVGGE